MSDDKVKKEARYAELQSERIQVEERLYWARHEGVSQSDRDALQRQWNDIRREQRALQNKPWIDKVDRRDDFTFERTERVNARGERIQTVRAEGKLSNPETTINWRTDTEYGKREDGVRRKISGGTGDDAGHLIKAEFGADPEGVNAGRVNCRGDDPLTGEPAERLNYGLQNRDINQGPGWKDVEDGTVRLVKQGDEACYRMEITSKTISTRDGGEREFYRTMTVRDGLGKPVDVTVKQQVLDGGKCVERPATVKVENYTAMNPHTPQSREKQGIDARQTKEEPGQVHRERESERKPTLADPKQRKPKMKV